MALLSAALRTFVSFKDFSQSMQFFDLLFPIFNFAFVNISLLEHSMFWYSEMVGILCTLDIVEEGLKNIVIHTYRLEFVC